MGSALIVSKASASHVGNFSAEAFCNLNRAASSRLRGEKPHPLPRQTMGPFFTDLILDYDDQREPETRMHRIDQVILTVDVININVVRVTPANRPRFAKTKPIAAVLKA